MQTNLRKNIFLKPADAALLALLRKALFSHSEIMPEITAEVDWEAVFIEALQQTVLPLALEAALSLPPSLRPSKELADEFRWVVRRQAGQNENMMSAQDELLKAFSDSEISSVILKGSSAAACYPQPELRVLGDIDVLVSPENVDKAKNTLLNLGYEQLPCDSAHHLVFFKQAVLVELHFEAAYFMDNRAARAMRTLMADALSNPPLAVLGAYTFPVLSTAQQAAFLLLHIQQHMKASGIGLRHLCDFVMFTARLKPDEWTGQVAPALQKVGLLRFGQALIKIGVLYLGLPAACAPWCRDVGDSVSHDLLMEFLRSGNFGRKDESHRASSVLTSDKTGQGATWFVPLTIVRNLNLYARKHYPLTRRLPVLLPLFWLYLPLEYLLKTLKNGGKPDIRKTLSAARTRKKLLAKLEILEVN